MKTRLLALLATIFLLTNVTFGQSVGEYRVRKAETITKKIEKPKKPKVIRENNPERRGCFVIPEVGLIGFDYEHSGYVCNAQGVFGYECNNHFAFGVGMGLNITGYSNFPVYINLRGDITKKPIIKNITPYYSVDFGYIYPITEYHKFNYSRYNDGIFFAPEIGVRINNFYIGADFLFTTNHYIYYDYDYYYNYFYNRKERQNPNLVLSLKFGYKIPLRIGR